MSLYCPRCDVHFEKDLSRCPGCGYDFRAHVLKEGFLKPPLDFTPLKELGRFLRFNAALVWINGLTVEVVWAISTLVILRGTYIGWTILLQMPPKADLPWMAIASGILATWLFFPILSTYLFSLLRRYRYHVPVPLFAVFAPPGRSRYGESMAWAPLCILVGAFLMFVFVVPGVVFSAIFVPFLLLMHLDKLNVSRRRRRFILEYVFLHLIGLFVIVGLVLTGLWGLIELIGATWSVPIGLIVAALLFPLQSVFAVLLYESLLGRENLDVD